MEVIEKVKNNKYQYVKKFIEKNAEKLKVKNMCEICYGSYTYMNKSHHLISKKHINALNYRKN